MSLSCNCHHLIISWRLVLRAHQVEKLLINSNKSRQTGEASGVKSWPKWHSAAALTRNAVCAGPRLMYDCNIPTTTAVPCIMCGHPSWWNTYMLFSKALLLSSSVSATADHWLEVSSIKTESLSLGGRPADWVSWGGRDRQTDRRIVYQEPCASNVDHARNKTNKGR